MATFGWSFRSGRSIVVVVVVDVASFLFLSPTLVGLPGLYWMLPPSLSSAIVDRPGLYGSDLTIGRFALLHSFVFSWFVWPGAFTAGF